MVSQNEEDGGKYEPQIRCSLLCLSINSPGAYLDFNTVDERKGNV